MDSPPESSQVSIELNEVSRQVATSLLENEDLNRSIGLMLSGIGRVLRVSRATLCRYRNRGYTVLHTHEWTPRGGEVHRLEPPAQPSARYSWAHEVLQRGDALRVPDSSSCTEVRAAAAAGLLEEGDRAMLVLPVFIFGELEDLILFVDENPRIWSDEVVSMLQLTVDAFARGIERKRTERENEKLARELEKAVQREKLANRYKSEFLANMSHELRTPMNAIVGYAELLARPNVDRRTQETWISNLKRSTEYLLTLINDVLDLSKIEAGHMNLELQSSSLVDVVAGVQDLLGGVAAEKLLSLEIEVQGELPREIETDPVRLEQVLVNLIGNAVKYTERGGVRLVLRASEDRQWLSFDIIDTGPGIALEDRLRLFRPFGQLHPSAREGTGLGLLISRHLARLLGGDISLESELGRGSTFTLEIPLSADWNDTFREVTPSPAADVGRAVVRTLSGSRILIADDSPENREVLRFLLEEAGASCEVAGNGVVAVDVALAAQSSGHPFDGVLMDMSMPVLDGYEATRRLVRQGFQAPIIALTAFAMAGDRERSFEAGCIDYLTKPIVPSRLLSRVEKHLALSQPRPLARDVDERSDPPFSLAGNPRFQQLIERYVASFPGWIETLQTLLAEGDLRELQTKAHRLRGTACHYGFPGISRFAGACEDALRAGRPLEEVSAAVTALVKGLSRAATG